MTAAARADVLVHVEDPGAANYVDGLEQAVAAAGLTLHLLVEGAATAYLQSAGAADADREPAALLADWRPRVVVAGTSENPDSRGLALLRAAVEASIPTVGIVDARSNADHRFRGHTDDPLAFAPGWIVVPDAATAGAYIELGFPAERIRQSLNPRFAAATQLGRSVTPAQRQDLRRRLFPGAGSDQQVVVFAAEVSTGLDPSQYVRSADYTLTGRGSSRARTDIVVEEVLDAVALIPPPAPYLVLRLHPKNTLEEFAPHLGAFDHVSQAEPALEVICAADVVIGMTSTLLLEAMAMERPALAVVPRPQERSWLPETADGGPPAVTDRQQLRAAVRRLLTEPPAATGVATPTSGAPADGLARLLVELASPAR